MEHEDRTTEMVEGQTARVPSLAFLGLAVGAMAASAALVLSGRKQLGNFVGQWAPSILIMGLYNKLAKEVAVPKREGRSGYGRRMEQTSIGGGAGIGAGI
jgi:hypothetical protein